MLVSIGWSQAGRNELAVKRSGHQILVLIEFLLGAVIDRRSPPRCPSRRSLVLQRANAR